MHRTKQPLLRWFWGAYLVTSETPGKSALQFKRQLGVKRYESAFMMLHKLRAGMVRPNRDRIGKGRDLETGAVRRYPVELDEAYVGGRTRGKGRGVTQKVVVVGAVEVRKSRKEEKDPRTGETKPKFYAGRLRLRMVPNRGKIVLTKFATESIEPGTMVRTDDWDGYVDLWKWFEHEPVMKADTGEDVSEFLEPMTKAQKAK
ncbi:MAG: IS1595 family transposase, partial [Candidatus Eisenbacteria bacterium]